MLVRRSFSLDTERDAEVLAWLDIQPNASDAITLEEVYSAIKALEAHINSGQWPGPAGARGATSAEDPDLAAQLDQLGCDTKGRGASPGTMVRLRLADQARGDLTPIITQRQGGFRHGFAHQ